LISQVEKENGIPNGEIKIQVMLETANAIQNAPDVAKASGRIVGLTLGGYDLLADLGIDPTEKELELLYARSRVIIAAKAAGVEVFDTVYPNIDDLEGLKRRAYRSVQLGFSGKAAIHPSQVSVIHEAYTPSLEDLERAVRVIKGATEAEAKGLGVVAVDGRMVDAPIIARAWRIVNLAHISGLEVEDL
jgi:citrate lyase subunit beta/citryl-CoA lyase